MKKRVLFVCVHNGARSQMAEALLNHHCGDCFEAASAGVHPGLINSLAIEVMAELGIDISRHRTKSIFEFIRQQPTFDYVITVCDESRGQHCPQFPRKTVHVQWDFPDPASFTGTRAERLARTRDVRDQILACIEGWCAQLCGTDEREADRPADQWEAAPPPAPQGMPA